MPVGMPAGTDTTELSPGGRVPMLVARVPRSVAAVPGLPTSVFAVPTFVAADGMPVITPRESVRAVNAVMVLE